MTPISRIEPQKASAEAATERHDSGIRALAAVARHQGLDWSLTRLGHVYGADHEPDARAMVRMARAEGLKAEVQKMDWKKLGKLQKQAPFLVRLNRVRQLGQKAGWGIGDDFNHYWSEAGMAGGE